MALPKFEKDIAHVSKLDDYPNDAGLSASDLKAVFDQAGQDIQKYLNDEFLPAAEEAIEAAALGVGSGGNFNGEQLLPGSVGESKLSDDSVSESKLQDDSVTADKIGRGAVSEDKIAEGAVSAAKISANAVTAEKLANSSVTQDKIYTGAVTNTKIGKGAVTADKIKEGATHSVKTITLKASDWSENNRQEVSVSGVSATKTIIVTSSPANHTAYCEAGVYCTEVSTDRLVFACVEKPKVLLSVHICILT